MRWAGHVACMGRGDVHTEFWWGDPRERDHLRRPVVDGRIMLKMNPFKKCDVEAWIRLMWLRTGTGGGLL